MPKFNKKVTKKVTIYLSEVRAMPKFIKKVTKNGK